MGIVKENVAITRTINIWVVLICITPILLIMASCTISQSPINDNSSISTAVGRLVFIMNDDIYSIALDGGDLKQLTSTSLRESDPVYSADGNTVCFTRQMEDQLYDYNDIFIMDSDGNNQRLIFKGDTDFLNYTPSFSPDGKKIVFLHHNCSSTNPGYSGLYEINIDGTGLKKLKDYARQPVYSSDGNFIYGNYISEGPAMMDINTLAKKAFNVKDSEAYSSDFTKIVFRDLSGPLWLYSGEYSWQVYIVNLDGTGVKQLTKDAGPKYKPIFTRDGTKIIFIHKEGNKKSIKIMNADGRNIKVLFKR